MKRNSPLTKKQAPATTAAAETLDDLSEQIVKRPDGYYWSAPGDRQDFGPFSSYEEAVADMQAENTETPMPGESLQEAESELGISDWIDPETGEPAEGHSPPHLDSE